MGAFIVYAPIELPRVTSIVNGGDARKVSVFPWGIIISLDSRLSSDRDSTANVYNGWILTVTFQMLISCHNNPTSQKQQMEVVASVHYLLSNTILKIKATLGCSDFLLFNFMFFFWRSGNLDNWWFRKMMHSLLFDVWKNLKIVRYVF